MIIVKILSLGAPERYAVRRIVTAAYQDFLQNNPTVEITIIEVSDSNEIGQSALTLVMPTLVINGKVVCSGRFPSRAEINTWLKETLDNK